MDVETTRPLTEAQPETTVTDEVVTMPRATVYAVVAAIVFFFIGYGVAWLSFSSVAGVQNEGLQDTVYEAVSQAFAELDLGALAANQGQQAEAPAAVVVVSEDDDPALGPADAPIVMVEFSDFRCPYCGRFYADTLQPLLERYEGQIRLVYRDFPVVGGALAAEAAECADDQGAFWDYHDTLFTNQSDLSETALISYAGQLDLDVETFTACLQGHVHQEEIQNDFLDGRSYNVTGTPTFFINGRRLIGARPLVVFQEMIDGILAEEAGG